MRRTLADLLSNDALAEFAAANAPDAQAMTAPDARVAAQGRRARDVAHTMVDTALPRGTYLSLTA